jgi:hypothetical protein
LEVFDYLLEPRCQNEIAIARQVAKEELEGSDFGSFTGLEVTGRHGELIEVGEESGHGRWLFKGVHMSVDDGHPGWAALSRDK